MNDVNDANDKMMNDMMRKILGIVLLCAVAVSAMAVPARRGWQNRTQADGTTIDVQVIGDEFYHYMINRDGKRIEMNEAGVYEVVGDAPTQEEAIARRAQAKAARRVQTAGVGRLLAPRGAVILVSYQDNAFQSSNALMTEWAMGENYTYNGATGSIRRYFLDQSWGQYDMQIDVYGPVTASRNGSYYGSNDAWGNDKHPDELVVEACQLAHDSCGADFSKYDSDGDGNVDWVVILYAGKGEADGGASNTIWPHQWELSYSGMDFQLDGKTVDHYCCLNEIDGQLNQLCGIGTFCHEFSHVMGLPDFYTTVQGATHHTLGDWDIMDYGPYNNDGNTPPSYSAYERWYMGWMNPTLINYACSVTMPDLNESKAACLMTEDGSNVENILNPSPATFYLLETRKQEGWDTYLPGAGMIVTKVQFNASKWKNNEVNNTASVQGVDLLEAQANTSRWSNGKATDAYPKGATEFTQITNYQVTDIALNDNGVISFNVNGGGNHVTLGVEDVPAEGKKAFKYIEHGTIVIERDGKKYDIVGRLIAQ